MSLANARQWQQSFPPLLSQYPSNYRLNVDGVLTLSNADAAAKSHRAYVQVFRSGVVEAVASSFVQGDHTPQNPARLTALRTEMCIVKYSYNYLNSLLSLGCEPPFALLVSLVGVKGIPYSFVLGRSPFEDEAGILDRDQFHFAEIIIEGIPDDVYSYAHVLRPLLDQIANAARRPFTPTFEGGRFVVKVD